MGALYRDGTLAQWRQASGRLATAVEGGDPHATFPPLIASARRRQALVENLNQMAAAREARRPAGGFLDLLRIMANPSPQRRGFY
ncbi:MAG: hypothetical protein QJR00_07975 [Bacillota bacterium]|nr:hypothetical protein [Bacillota bacterium]